MSGFIAFGFKGTLRCKSCVCLYVTENSMHVFSILSKIRILVLLAVDACFFGSVSPASGNSFVVIAGGLLLALTIYNVLQLVMMPMVVFVSMPSVLQKRVSLFITLIAMFLLLMQSIGQLDLRDSLAIVALGIISFFYSSYTAKST